MRVLAAWMMLGALLSGCLAGPGEDSSTEPIVNPVDDFVPRVVLAVLDTGIQPYHDEFRMIASGLDGTAHPSTYLTGYPEDSEALGLTLDLSGPDGSRETEAAAYLEADEELWEDTELEKMYWIPGTKIIGIYAFDAQLPGGGHGTMTSSRSVGNTVSIGKGEILLLKVRAPLAIQLGPGEDTMAKATRWISDQAYVDIQSHSWGMPFTCAGIATSQTWGWAEAFKYARDRHLVFVAAGNGHGNTGLTPGYPSHCQDNSGVAGVITVSATDNGGITSWANYFPAIAADGCSNPAADEETVDELSNNGGGTSSATPYSAGGAAQMLLEARRILRDPRVGVRDGVLAEAHDGAVLPTKGPLADGVFTMDELKSVLFHTAQSPPVADESDGDTCINSIPHQEGVDGLAYFPFIGYGEINEDSIARALRVLQGLDDEPARPDEDELYARDQAARRAFWG